MRVDVFLIPVTAHAAASEIRARYFDDQDSEEWDMGAPCLPMPEAWTLQAAASVLRKEGKEAAAIELEKLAQHASGAANIPLMRRASSSSDDAVRFDSCTVAMPAIHCHRCTLNFPRQFFSSALD